MRTKTSCAVFKCTGDCGRGALEWEKIDRGADKEMRVSWSVEHHTRLSTGGVEDPVVRARLGSQVRLVVLPITIIRTRLLGRWGRGRGRAGLRRGQDNSRLFLGRHGRWRRHLLLHFRLGNCSFWCWKGRHWNKRINPFFALKYKFKSVDIFSFVTHQVMIWVQVPHLDCPEK